ncbi:hypothetical protein [Mesorhizobium sp.]|uniref:hypothetical protein n=1 Tax=Mesorhizobium sp. TaxID=1871066 RepID=UPI000FE3EFE6|nr:hypothetical protein [Mesorhizobium sp.]RWN48878.1 MAG: hypothetical protein EOR98_34365 [Mesorhizobium sp.]RWN69010.1 MAG: hypothetical protein EOS01_34620 [Mesorhizobium sp.]RWN69590.1 MAG: hypothetical protein EOS02_34410 [Mesorhizobium sp.]RWN81231.1 MAG: hypothetical protein EOS04_34325 [Mesorhizobium sp.]RWO05758.1 MAG: hypothetical protein EOS15_34770 [Mesorhizobium sp.]
MGIASAKSAAAADHSDGTFRGPASKTQIPPFSENGNLIRRFVYYNGLICRLSALLLDWLAHHKRGGDIGNC